jgi:proteasome accessory factor B
MPPSSARRISKTQRWLDLIALLLGRKLPLSVEEIMERVPAYSAGWATGSPTPQASARRMFERDKDELRRMGVPIETVRYAISFGNEELEGYRIIRQDIYLPYLKILAAEPGAGAPPHPRPYPALPEVELRAEEASLAIEALRLMEGVPAFPFAAEARSGLRKLAFDLPTEALQGPSVLWVERPGTRELLERLRLLSDALLARKIVRFTYDGIHRGVTTEREVAAYGLFFQRDWYLVGHDASRGEIRVFRVARMDSVVPDSRAPRAPDYEIPADFALESCLHRSPWELGDLSEVIEADAHFRFPLSLWAERNGEGERIEERPDGSAVRRFRVAQSNPFLRWVLGFAGEVEILGPPELVNEYREMAERVAALYAAEGVHG